jgi:hypothetical protein
MTGYAIRLPGSVHSHQDERGSWPIPKLLFTIITCVKLSGSAMMPTKFATQPRRIVDEWLTALQSNAGRYPAVEVVGKPPLGTTGARFARLGVIHVRTGSAQQSHIS